MLSNTSLLLGKPPDLCCSCGLSSRSDDPSQASLWSVSHLQPPPTQSLCSPRPDSFFQSPLIMPGPESPRELHCTQEESQSQPGLPAPQGSPPNALCRPVLSFPTTAPPTLSTDKTPCSPDTCLFLDSLPLLSAVLQRPSPHPPQGLH